MNKEQAKQNLLILINMCVKAGGIFNNADTVLSMVDSVHALAADTSAPLMAGMPGGKALSAAEQIEERLNGKK